MAKVMTDFSWTTKVEKDLANSEKKMADVVLARSRIIAPILTGALKADGRIEKDANGGLIVKFGGDTVPYARRRHFENKKNPQTLHYLKRGGDSVAKESIKRYL